MAVHDDGGDITGYLGIHRDVTERERAEARLEEARELERSRIARALHDDALQALAAAMVLATAARGASPSGLTSQLVLKLQRVGRQLRGAIFDLRLGAEHKALPLVLEELVAVHREMGGVEIGIADWARHTRRPVWNRRHRVGADRGRGIDQRSPPCAMPATS